MTRLSVAKLAVGAVALAVWAIGARADDARLRWAGIALLAGAFLLRFFEPKPGRDAQPAPPDDR